MGKSKILIAIGLTVSLLFSGCSLFKRTSPKKPKETEIINLTYYRFGAKDQVLEQMVKDYSTVEKNLRVQFKYFDNLEQYEDLIINELAEGEGPDIFSMPNHWIYKHQKKISPMPVEIMNATTFRETFVDVADRDLIRPDETGRLRVYGIPLFVDTLATYYNKNHYEDRIPERGSPGKKWDIFQEDIFQLTKKNKDGNFEVFGAALGRADNIKAAVDILYALMLQHKTQLYNDEFTKADFAHQQDGLEESPTKIPALDALNFFTQFGKTSSKAYSWSKNAADAESELKEIETFARGETSVIFGYSDTYEKILEGIKKAKVDKKKTISDKAIRIAPFPQVEDPKVTTSKRNVLARYFAETISRTSTHSDVAWRLLRHLSSKENLDHYFTETKKPTSRRDLLNKQKQDPIYGTFASQTGFATSMPIYNEQKFREIFTNLIQEVVEKKTTPSQAITKAEKAISELLPEKGFAGPGPYIDTFSEEGE